jgi:hypothetical protein
MTRETRGAVSIVRTIDCVRDSAARRTGRPLGQGDWTSSLASIYDPPVPCDP